MAWLIPLLEMLGVPALKIALYILEKKFPGLAPVIEAILKYLSGGGSLPTLGGHLDKLDGFSCSKQANV